MKRNFGLAALILVSGCATDMEVTKGSCDSSCDGFPIRMPVTVKITETTSFRLRPDVDQSLGWLCTEERRQLFDSLPLGELYYINYDGGWLAKTEFSAEFHPSGLLKTVSINSDPTQVVESTAGLIEAALPIAFPDRAAEAAGLDGNDRNLSNLKKENCIETSRTRTVERLSFESDGN